MAAAKKFYKQYPTIVNNIPKETNHYNNTPEDFARIDNNLAASQRAIGESSNLAQIALSYTYNYNDKVCYDSVCILSVLAQCAIDNSKRKYDIDITNEIKRLKTILKVKDRGYPSFWTVIRPGFNKSLINKKLKCPMNYIYKIRIPSYNPETSTLPISEFYVKYDMPKYKKKHSRKVEKIIEKYSLKKLLAVKDIDDLESDNYIIAEETFDELIEEIKNVYISNNYLDLMSWLIRRAFQMLPGTNLASLQAKTFNDCSVLSKILFRLNPNSFLKCFKSGTLEHFPPF